MKEREKNSTVNGEAVPAVTKPVELPAVAASDQPVRLTPLLDPQLILSQREGIKLGLASTADEEAPPPPPAKTHTRPRRITEPKSQTPASDQPTQTEPERLRRPPAQTDPTRLRRPPAQNNPPSNQQ